MTRNSTITVARKSGKRDTVQIIRRSIESRPCKLKTQASALPAKPCGALAREIEHLLRQRPIAFPRIIAEIGGT